MTTKKIRSVKARKRKDAKSRSVAIIGRHERLMMTDRDRDRFLKALDRPPKLLPALAKAARQHALAIRGE